MIERIILIEDAAPTGPAWIATVMSRARERGRPGHGVRAADEERRPVQPRMDRRHHRDVDIAPAGGVHFLGGALLGLRRAGIAVEEECAFCEARQRGDRRLMRLIGRDDREDRLRARDRLRRARRADHVGCDIVGALAGPHPGSGELS